MVERLLPLEAIRRDDACQPRATTYLEMVQDYAEAMLAGAQFPAVVVFYDGDAYWLADGYHRTDAAEAALRTEILADVRDGTKRDAILHSLGANAAHGLKRSNEDKRRAVMTMLQDAEWSRNSDRDIARHCGVAPMTVIRYRTAVMADLSVPNGQIAPDPLRLVTRGGTTYEMNTAAIGEPTPAPSPPADGPGPQEPEIRTPADWRPDQTYAHFVHSLRDVMDGIAALPSPAETIANFPEWAEHAPQLAVETVNAAAAWLTEFAQIWALGETGRQERRQRIIDFARTNGVRFSDGSGDAARQGRSRRE
jgi:hypothetical protein